MEKVVVTGGAGFIGSHLVDALVDLGYEVHVIDNLFSGKKEYVNKKVKLHIIDIRDKEKIELIIKDAKYVFHEAAIPQVQYSIENPVLTNEVNVVGLLNVLEAARLNKVKRLIFASSSAIYGDTDELPLEETAKAKAISPYGTQKYVGEKYCKLYADIYKIETVCLRYFNVYGPRQYAVDDNSSVISKFIKFHKENNPLIITGDGKQTRDFVHVKDVVLANLLAMKGENVGRGEVINIGTGKGIAINHIANLIGGKILRQAARKEPLNSYANINKAKELLGWSPEISIEDGLHMLMKDSL